MAMEKAFQKKFTNCVSREPSTLPNSASVRYDSL